MGWTCSQSAIPTSHVPTSSHALDRDASAHGGDLAGDGSSTTSADPGESRYLRLPWPLVSGALLLVLAAALGAGLYANRYIRPQVGIVATVGPIETPVPAVLAQPPVPTPVRVATQAAASAPTPVPAATLGVIALSTPATSTPAPASQPTVEPPSASPTAKPTVDPVLAEEVDAAYQHYWQVRAEALFDLDTSHLSEVMAGDHLTAAEKLINELRSEGRAIQTEVDHNYAIVSASQDEADIADMYLDTSVYVDPTSHAPVSVASNDTLRELYRMRRIDGTWRVVSLGRAS